MISPARQAYCLTHATYWTLWRLFYSIHPNNELASMILLDIVTYLPPQEQGFTPPLYISNIAPGFFLNVNWILNMLDTCCIGDYDSSRQRYKQKLMLMYSPPAPFFASIFCPFLNPYLQGSGGVKFRGNVGCRFHACPRVLCCHSVAICHPHVATPIWPRVPRV